MRIRIASPELEELPSAPESLGRYRGVDRSLFDEGDIELVEQLGFEVY